MSDLDTKLLAAHAAADTATLVRLYQQAADLAQDDDASSFYLTHAYVFALEIDHPDRSHLYDRLKRLGREE